MEAKFLLVVLGLLPAFILGALVVTGLSASMVAILFGSLALLLTIVLTWRAIWRRKALRVLAEKHEPLPELTV